MKNTTHNRQSFTSAGGVAIVREELPMNRLACLAAPRKAFRAWGFLLAAIALAAPAAFAGVNRWTTSWTTSLSSGAGRPESGLATDLLSSSTVYAATNGGVFKTVGSGGEWAPVGPPVSNARVHSVAIDPAAPSTVYAGTAGDLFKSTDGGASWSGRLQSSWIYSLVFSPQTPSTIFAADFDSFYYYPSTLYRSSNEGATWSRSNPIFRISPGALAIDPTSPSTLYAGAADHPSYYAGLGRSGVYKSEDSGSTWRQVFGIDLSPGNVTDVLIDPGNAGTLYAATTRGGVFRSADAGESWREINSGLTSAEVHVLAIDPSAPATLYAGTSGGVFKSTNGGGNWTAISAGLSNTVVSALAIDPSAPETLYAGTRGGGVFRSTNAGSTWTAFNAGLGNPTVNELAITSIASCVSGPTTLCLSGGRFGVTTRWATRDGLSGAGQAVALPGGDAGYFTFFDRDNVEVAVKILNGCSTNGSFWTLAGGLTDVSVVMTVSDSQTGAVRTYSNPQGTPFQPIQDINAFATCDFGSAAGARPYGGPLGAPLIPPNVMESFDASATEPCVPSATTLCLSDSRYQVRTQWFAPDGRNGPGQVLNLTGDTGAFWFFSSSNVEMVVKVLDACGVNSRYWTFAGGLTDVNVIMTVTDTQTGAVKTYTNPQATPFQPVQDTDAFATCP